MDFIHSTLKLPYIFNVLLSMLIQKCSTFYNFLHFICNMIKHISFLNSFFNLTNGTVHNVSVRSKQDIDLLSLLKELKGFFNVIFK